MSKFFNWYSCIILGTTIPLGLSFLSLRYLDVDEEKERIHKYNNEYRQKQRELMNKRKEEKEKEERDKENNKRM